MSLPAFKSVADLQGKVDLYFEDCEQTGDIPNVLGLCVFMDICRDTFAEYAKKSEYSDTIKKAKDKIYQKKYQFAAKGEMDRTIFIFDCVNNHDMINTRSEQKSKTELTGKDGQDLSLTVNFVSDKS